MISKEQASLLLGTNWVEMPVNLEESDMKCDPGLIPRKVFFIRIDLPRGKKKLKLLEEAWGYKGIKL